MKSIFLIIYLCFGIQANAQESTTLWTADQVLKASILASRINNNELNGMLVLCVGPDAAVKNSIPFDIVSDKENMKKFKKYLKNVSKDQEIVIYCGCCPNDVCPNLTPAFEYMQKKKFTNFKILEIPENIKVDWILKDYPVNS